METFKDFKLSPVIEKALAQLQFNTPTPIQKQALPIILSGKDLIGCAQTGTGKTAAFCIPILTRLLETPGKNALILVPTRELAIQIDIFWKSLTQKIPGMHAAVIVGGTNMFNQIRNLSKHPRLIIATPGRLVDHLGRKNVNISQMSILVLDEADRMLDMGFTYQLNDILKYLPAQRQTLFFTATWPSELDRLSKKYLKEPARITVGSMSQAAPQIKQSVIATKNQNKNETLLDELNQRSGSILIFARTQARTDYVARYLSEYGIQTNRLHGGRSQSQRNAALSLFRSGKVRILVATDIAARGIDVKDIAHVVNYDLPQSCDDYIHRIGRTGRAGATGEAVSLLTPEDRFQWQKISQFLKKSGSNVPTLPFSKEPTKSAPREQIKSAPREQISPRKPFVPFKNKKDKKPSIKLRTEHDTQHKGIIIA